MTADVRSGALPADEVLAAAQVAVLLESAGDFAVAVMGCWMVGRGVLPLPVAFPDARLRIMLLDCGPAALLTTRDLVDRASSLLDALPGDCRLVLLDGDEPPTPPAKDESNLAGAAYTVYTSGSTGLPKGVLIRRDQLAHLMGWTEREFRPGPGMRMAQTLSLGFDFGLQELFTTLPFAGCLVVPGPADRTTAMAYAQFLRREQVNTLFITPSYAAQIVATGIGLPDLRLVQIAGELLDGSVVSGLRALIGADCRIYNGYGPTEATINCLVHEISDADTSSTVPVGRGSAAAQLALIDPHGAPVPAGATGELIVGGPGVARGYVHRPELSAKVFGPDPSGQLEGLVYRTGDLGYVRPDGRLVIVGRVDRQYKIRGHRVELGEVEHVLRGLPRVTEAVAVVTGAPPRLVAVVVGDGVNPQRVIAAAAEHLVPATVPERVLVLDRIPTTANGKVDIARLNELAGDALSAPSPVGAGRTDVERLVCTVWADAIATTEVRPADNVFELGAHSLVVTQVHSQLEASLGIRFPVHQLFQYPVAGKLAEHLSMRLREQSSATLTTTGEAS